MTSDQGYLTLNEIQIMKQPQGPAVVWCGKIASGWHGPRRTIPRWKKKKRGEEGGREGNDTNPNDEMPTWAIILRSSKCPIRQIRKVGSEGPELQLLSP